jgi:uncharacterized protein (TIGR04222 family)
MRNPLTEITGPEFLVLFAVVITAVAVFCWLLHRGRDKSLDGSPVRAPEKIDPYEVAYLRGQGHELARVLIVRLVELKYLQIMVSEKWWNTYDTRRSIEQTKDHPPLENLSAIEQAAFRWFKTSRTPEEVFGTPPSWSSLMGTSLSTALISYTVEHERKLHASSMLTPNEVQEGAHRTVAIGIAIVLLIGLTRLAIGISRDKPVGFLVLMGILGILVIVWAGKPGRLSRRGRAYLNSIRTKWQWLQQSRFGQDWSPTLAAGVFGFGVLSGTEWSSLSDSFRRSRHSSITGNDGCGAGCGSGGCGGGGCGGGCGGCGG